jgi:hypothetical protein
MSSPAHDIVAARKTALEQELIDGIAFEHSRAVGDYWIGNMLMIITLASSAAAGFGGLLNWFSPQVIGALALVPGILALAEGEMKFHGKSEWHYRKQYALEGLHSRLRFQMPAAPNADQIAAIASERDDLKIKMNKEWNERFQLNWTAFGRKKP